MKVMISQPMAGKTNEQIKQDRQKLVSQLKDKGYEVVDTIISENAPSNSTEAIFYLSKSIEYISKVDAVVFMSGWKNARGCRIEHNVALEYGKFIMEEEE